MNNKTQLEGAKFMLLCKLDKCTSLNEHERIMNDLANLDFEMKIVGLPSVLYLTAKKVNDRIKELGYELEKVKFRKDMCNNVVIYRKLLSRMTLLIDSIEDNKKILNSIVESNSGKV